MISIVDYGLGNILAFFNIYKRLNIPVSVVNTPERLLSAKKIVLPGVGSFDWAMSRLNGSGLREVLDTLVVEKQVPVIGVCVGMQMMANRSEEGVSEGLGWLDAEVKRFDEERFVQTTHLPHMGWNDVLPKNADCLFKNMDSMPRFYFLHSYYFSPNNTNEILATSEYVGEFVSSIRSGNAFGVQFHPEKSHQWGVQLLKNFSEL